MIYPKWTFPVLIICFVTFYSCADRKQIEESYKALKRIEAQLQTGVNIVEYSKAVAEARLQLNLIGRESEASKQLEGIFECYQIANGIRSSGVTADCEALVQYLQLAVRMLPEGEANSVVRSCIDKAYDESFGIWNSFQDYETLCSDIAEKDWKGEMLREICDCVDPVKQQLWAKASEELLAYKR